MSKKDILEQPDAVDLPDNASKLSFVVGLLRKFAGARDLVSLRISLPANLMDPQSNLEFWNYQDRPDLFVAIADGEEPLERMLRTIRWWFSKDTKWKASRPDRNPFFRCFESPQSERAASHHKKQDNQLRKPYNPILGEQFICSWPLANHKLHLSSPSEASLATMAQPSSTSLHRTSISTTASSNTSAQKHLGFSSDDQLKIAESAANAPPAVHCVTEQISHHPPISAFCYFSNDLRILARGIDHVVAKFTGMAFKVGPGEYNSGVYITLPHLDGEEYNISHAWATVNGLLTGSPYIVVSEQTVILCPKTGLKAIIEYKDEPIFGRPKFAIEAKIYRYDYSRDHKLSERERRDAERISKIPKEDVLCTLSGAWNGRITYRLANSDKDVLLFDMRESEQALKVVRPIDMQSSLESRCVWRTLTEALAAKDYGRATREKRAIEDRQRRLATEKTSGVAESGQNRRMPALFDLKHDIFASSDVQGPPLGMDKGKPSLKPHVIHAILSGSDLRDVLEPVLDKQHQSATCE